MRIQNIIKTVAAFGALALATAGQAKPILEPPSTYCGSDAATVNGVSGIGGGSAYRQAVSSGAVSYCSVSDPAGNGTPGAADVNNVFPGSWAGAGAVDSSKTNSYLTVTLLSGSWGSSASGTWTISPAFWTTYGSAVISMHVGNGNNGEETKNPDWWFWSITPGQTTGNFAYNMTNGGGLSNLFLWGSGTPTQVPEPATLGLLGLGLAGVGFARRRKIAA